ncbi:diphthine synthase [Methermicoccus shengliensis]|uniref:Diphthine synthase n=1 Tax=Methermicoccus shengliensis TaxID=660064 RepID=A0A832RUX3_9EURY|nr:diphthine synthase [Methermicoccus shengliensis]KUK05252.1 MAG: Diphthine synthase [Euryarchaeota archaeon 55_53]KUK30333.1 MAG: Diphthine synthase [Methanosarcinales archeaon 56_1174]MDI3487839.1 diphthine synthase [Methanosarcinales archaeon]MDN5294514.1 diphthine synthase [Methanosarcinales archaeon]HIH69757.1 diphthine synthase [Methermicoccus shengliensis]
MLTFVGLGLFDEHDITLKGLRAVQQADEVYAEFYTSRLCGASIEQLEALYGKKVHVLSREDIEGHPTFIERARELDVVLLSGGDPMVSTTHVDLRLRAHRMGIATRIVHAPSIVSAVCGLTGLQNYRFGRSATVPFPYEHGERRMVYESPYDVVRENLERNLHTLLYMDIQNGRFMRASEGAALLLEVAQRRGDEGLSSRLGVAIARAGSEDCVVRAAPLEDIASMELGPPLHVLVVPAELHFMEAEALVEFAKAPRHILEG